MELVLKSGDVLRFDAEDMDLVMQYNWRAHKNHNRRSGTKYAMAVVNVTLHRLLMNAKPGEIVDHINGDALDNRKCNLRLVTTAQNMQNQTSCYGTSKFKGVSLKRGYKSKPWIAQICVAGKRIYLGTFAIEEAAARAYNEAATKHFGEFTRLNEL